MKECPTCRNCFADDVNNCPDDGSETAASISRGPILGGIYQLEKHLGQGGLVYKARSIYLKTQHAIKIILLDPVGDDPNLETRSRQDAEHEYRLSWLLMNTALAATAIRHQNIIAVTNFGTGGTMPYLVMEFVQGKSLQDIMAEEGAMPPMRAFELIEPICAGIAAAHRRGIVHGDLKPSNVMIQEGVPVSEGLKILDFGMAKIRSGELLGSFIAAQARGVMSSPFYTAPEQWSGDPPDARADIYSLGVMLYQMLCGEVPFKGSSIPSIMEKHLTLEVPTLASKGIEVPPQIEAVIRHALEKEATARPFTAEAFLIELNDALGPATKYRSAPPLESSPPEIPTGEEPVQAEDKPKYLDENVQFTVYRPKKIKPLEWYTLLAYAHLSERAPDRPDETDPIEKMQAEVKKKLGEEELKRYSPATEDSSQAVPREGEITFVPFMEGIEFNPPSCSFLWLESVHGQEFRMRASPALDGKTARGRMSVFLGAILLAEINLSIQVDSVHALDVDRTAHEPEQPARPYRNIFPSYSHKDLEIVAQIEQYAQISGDKYMRDVNELRSGQNWKQWMKEAIARADIFQLFWSTNSMRSENVRLEWEHALALQRPHFIRPTYWEEPLPKSPAENLPPPELRDLHFQQVRPFVKIDSASEKERRDNLEAESKGAGQKPRAVIDHPSVAGSSGSENNYILDGVNTTDSAFGGSGAGPPFLQVKRCPTCKRIYLDMSLRFCLEDGALLLNPSLEPAAPLSAPPPQGPAHRLENQRSEKLQPLKASGPALPRAQWSPPTASRKSSTLPILIGILFVVIVALFILGLVIASMLK